jgi:hypothetical protein
VEEPVDKTPPSPSSANPQTVEEADTKDLSPYSLRMQLTAILPEEEAPSGEGFVGETERKRVEAMQWVGLPQVSGGNRVPLGPWKKGIKPD